MSNVAMANSWKFVVLSFTVSVLIGVFFGAYPASRATALTLMQALRYQ
jgi:putative ABC transport system permease protein